MASFRSIVIWLLALLVLCGVIVFTIVNYSWVFSKHVIGEILDVQRVTNPTAILGKTTDDQIHSYAVLIQGVDGKLYTASSDDRQWQVAHKGYCVDALLYVYPPWDLKNSGTYFNARVNQLSFCPGKPPPPEAKPDVSPTPAAPAGIPGVQ